MRNTIFVLCVIAFPVLTGNAFAQVPFEVFGGDKKASLDLMFFRYFTGENDAQTPFLFFNRNRALYNYKMTGTANLPSFGFTEAVSWNTPALKGLAPVAVLQLLNRGAYTKLGVQYVHITKEITLFSWVVAQLNKSTDTDFFLLFRYTPELSERLKAFLQVETLNTFPEDSSGLYSFTQRVRIGVQTGKTAFGFAADVQQTGNNKYTVTENYGGFVRYQF